MLPRRPAVIGHARAVLAAAAAMRQAADQVNGLVRGQLTVGMVTACTPLADRSSVSLTDLAGYPVISMPAGTGVRAVFDRACAEAGLQPSIALQASAPSAVADLASRGLGVAIFSATMATFYSDRLTAVPVSGVSTPSVLALVWSTSPSPALREFLSYAREAFGMPEARPAMGRAPVIS